MKQAIQWSFVVACAWLFMAYHTGSPGGRTGSPSDGKTCGTMGCHGVQAGNPEDMLSLDIPLAGYRLDSTYDVSVTASEVGITKYGFELVAQDTAGVSQGTFIENTFVNAFDADRRVTHRSSSTGAASGTKTWDFQWKAPSSAVGPVHFYLAVLAADGSGTNTGDEVLLDNQLVSEATVASIANQGTAAVRVAQSVDGERLWIKGAGAAGTVVQVWDLQGRKLLETRDQTQINIQSLRKGMYLLQWSRQGETSIYKFIKR